MLVPKELLNVKAGLKGVQPGHKHCVEFEQTWWYGEVALKYK